MDRYLTGLESKTIYILREAYNRLNPLCMLWSAGKDSTALLWMVKKAFFGDVPFPVVLLDTGMELDEVYAFRDMLVQDWKLDCINHICPSEKGIDKNILPASRAAMRKTEGLRSFLQTYDFKGVICGIRRDEQGLRAKERVFSPRHADGSWEFKDQPPEFWDYYETMYPKGGHMRIHPLLHWTEVDIWQYIKHENIPSCDLYFAKNGKRYRSLGEKNITMPVESNAATIDEIIEELETTKISERSGRTIDRETEDSFEKLRVSGYM